MTTVRRRFHFANMSQPFVSDCKLVCNSCACTETVKFSDPGTSPQWLRALLLLLLLLSEFLLSSDFQGTKTFSFRNRLWGKWQTRQCSWSYTYMERSFKEVEVVWSRLQNDGSPTNKDCFTGDGRKQWSRGRPPRRWTNDSVHWCGSSFHRRRRRGQGGSSPPPKKKKIRKKNIFSGNYYVKFGHFSDKIV